MKLFITDDSNLYKSDNSTCKLLFQNCYIKESKGIEKSIIEKINYSNNDVEYRAAEILFSELETLIEKLSNTNLDANRYIKTRHEKDQAFTLLYPFAIKYLLPKHVLLITVNYLLELIPKASPLDVTFNLADVYLLAESELKALTISTKVSTVFREEKVSAFIQLKKQIKNIFYQIYHLFYSLKFYFIKPKTEGKRHILLVMYDTPPDLKLFETFFELIHKNKDCHLSIIQVESGIDKQYTIPTKLLKGNNISVYNFQSFRKGSFSNNKFYDAIENIDTRFSIFRKSNLLQGINLHYEWMNNIFEKLNPDVCIYHKQTELGRKLADVARYHKKPSVNLQYALTFDTPFLKQNIHFTARACINTLNANYWKKNNDPSDAHPVIGFCKLDSLNKIQVDKPTFFKNNNLDSNKKTILFASTWSAENKIFDEEKKEIVIQLSMLCDKNNWNLIIKKHPSEFDTIVDEALKQNPPKNPSSNQKIFLHSELPLAEALLLSDFMCCQSSSAILEAIYFGKPFCFLSFTQRESTSKYNEADITEFVPIMHDISTFEKYAQSVFDDTNQDFSRDKTGLLQEKYLHKTDGMASQRLLDLLLAVEYIG